MDKQKEVIIDRAVIDQPPKVQEPAKAQEPTPPNAQATAPATTTPASVVAKANPRIGDVVKTVQGIFLIADRNKNGVHRAISANFQETSVHPADVLQVLGNLGKTFGMQVEEIEAQE